MRKEMKKDNKRTKEGKTILHLAVQQGLLNLVKNLIEEEGHDINERDGSGCTPLFYASGIGDLEMTKYLVEEGADLSARAENGATALHIAARANNLEVVQYLTEKGADMNATDNQGDTPLDYALDTLDAFHNKSLH